MKRIAVVGTRPPKSGLQEHREFFSLLADFDTWFESMLPPLGWWSDMKSMLNWMPWVLVSGGAEGIDDHAARAYEGQFIDCGIGELVVHRPDYDRFGGRAPLERNTLIVRDADEVHAWPSSWSRGTHDTIRKACGMKKPTFVHAPRRGLTT